MKTFVSIVRTVLLAAVMVISGSALAREAVPIVNPTDIPVAPASGKKLTATEVQQVIARVATDKKWIVSAARDGKFTASLSWNSNKHTIVVEIACMPDRYSITYKDSLNMKYEVLNGVPKIHPYYDRHINALRDAIRIEFMKL